ncbi:hypothetical protein STEG23_038259 [Scotinomys teguina]
MYSKSAASRKRSLEFKLQCFGVLANTQNQGFSEVTQYIVDKDAENHCHRRDYLHYIRKYNRFEKRHKNMSVHLSPCFRDVQIGDIVTVGECRPLSKTVRFNVLKVTKAAGTKNQFQKF